MLYIAEGGQCSVAASDNFLQAATIEVGISMTADSKECRALKRVYLYLTFSLCE